jgi:hypothetical protein
VLAHELRDPFRELVGGYLIEPQARQNLRVGEAPLRLGGLPGARERIEIAHADEKCRAVEDVTLAGQRKEFLIHRFVLDGVYEVVRAGVQRGLRHQQLSGVYRQSQARRVRRLRGGAYDRFLRGEIVVRAMNEPHLDVIGLAFQFPCHQLPCLLPGADPHDRWIAQVQLRVIHHGDERPGHRDAGRRGTVAGGIAHLEIPEWSADVRDAGDAARQPDPKSLRQSGLVALHLGCIRPPRAEVRGVRPRIEIARLEEVHVGIDQSGNDPLAVAIDHPGAARHLGRGRSPHGLDAVTGDDHGAVG